MRLAPYIVTFGLLGSALAWQGAPALFGEDAGTAREVVVANYGVPAVEGGDPAATPSPVEPSSAPVDPAPTGTPSQEPAAESHVASEGGHVIAELPQQTVAPFSLIGVTWASGMPATAEIEVQWHGSGGWSAWTHLHQDLVPIDDGPGRPGTEPQWVDWADGIAVRVTNPTPAAPVDLKVAAVTGSKASDIAPMAATQPGIILRSQWGARGAASCASPQYGPSTQGAVIHHTAGKNSYTAAESPGIVRSIQAYHMSARDWCDIGYNFLVDRYGQIFEGRGGGIDRPVRGAHAGNATVNENSVGVSLMGTFTSEDATPEMKNAVAQLVAWRFALAGVPAKGVVTAGGKQYNRIGGHRDVVSTACPGELVYKWIGAPGGLRDQVERILASTPPPAPAAPATQPAAPQPPAPAPVIQTQAPAPPPAVTTPTGLEVTKRYVRKLKLEWDSVPGAKKYQIRVSRERSMSYPKVEDSIDTDQKVKLRASGQRYYVQVRAVRPDGSKTSWSDKVKTSTKRS